MERSTARITVTPPVEGHQRVYNESTPPRVIEEDIARTRVRLSGTIAALERELAPAQVLDKSRMMLRSALAPAAGPSHHQQVAAYAIPLALILTGLGWLFLLRRRYYQAEMPAATGTTQTEAVEIGETPAPAPSYTDVAGPVEPVSLVDENTSI